MKIIVCVKQVPDTTEIKIDPVTNTLIRAGVPSIVNPYDAYALETALRLKERYGAEVLVISMGPEQAKEALKECLWYLHRTACFGRMNCDLYYTSLYFWMQLSVAFL